MSDTRYESFEEFFPFYLSEHSYPLNRWLHFIGSSLAACSLVLAFVLGSGWLALLAPVLGYGLAWLGHYAVESNKPASFRYPLWSLLGDLRMYGLMLTGRAQQTLDDYHARGVVHSLWPADR
jgi:hypothetical protein